MKSIKQGGKNAQKAKEFIAFVKSGNLGKSLKANEVIDSRSGKIETIEEYGSVSVDLAVNEITTSWRKTNEAIIETAELIQKYRRTSNWSDIATKLIDDYIPKSTLAYLTSIGNNSVLMNRKYTDKLPNELMKIYFLSQMSENILELKIKSNQIHPKVEASIIKKWNQKEPRRIAHLAKTNKTIQSVTISLKITLPYDNHKSNAKRIKNDVKELLTNEDVDVVLDEKIKMNY